MSSFIKNLARRGAGLPLAAECRPASAPAFETSFEASDGFDEITSEPIVATHVDAPAAHSLQTLNTSTVPQVQRSPMEQVSAAPQPKSSSPPYLTTVLQPAASMEPIVPSTEITAPQTDAPRANETLARPMAIAPRHSEFTLPDEPAPSRVDRPETETRSLPAATNPRGRQHPKPAISVKEDREGAPNGVELVTTDHVIRPAATEATVSLEFPSNISPSPQPAPQLPIQVRIGRVEVRGTPPAPEPTRATPMETPPLGFASYHRLRRYRN